MRIKNAVYVLIVNWNGWGDTIECLESVFRITDEKIKIIVCDNNSQDKSIENIKKWADGDLDSWIPCGNSLRRLSFPPVQKRIKYAEYGREEAENGGRQTDQDARLILVHTGGNLGFAGGNNVGLRYALARNDFEFVWLLNNDAVVQQDSLTPMVQCLHRNPKVGMCGSTLLYYHQPQTIQAQGGGTVKRWTGLTGHIGRGRPYSDRLNEDQVLEKLAYVVGASMLVTKRFLLDIGLMNEEYFLYMEELDWSERSKGKYALAYAPESHVFHKEGSTIGSDSSGVGSELSQTHLFRNRIKFYKKYHKKFVPLVIGFMIMQSVVALGKGRLSRFLIIWNAIRAGFSQVRQG